MPFSCCWWMVNHLIGLYNLPLIEHFFFSSFYPLFWLSKAPTHSGFPSTQSMSMGRECVRVEEGGNQIINSMGNHLVGKVIRRKKGKKKVIKSKIKQTDANNSSTGREWMREQKCQKWEKRKNSFRQHFSRFCLFLFFKQINFENNSFFFPRPWRASPLPLITASLLSGEFSFSGFFLPLLNLLSSVHQQKQLRNNSSTLFLSLLWSVSLCFHPSLNCSH